MNIDNNTLTLIGLALATTYFAYHFFKNRMDSKFAELHRSIQDAREQNWRDIDSIQQDVDNLTRRVDCCSKQKASCANQGSVSY